MAGCLFYLVRNFCLYCCFYRLVSYSFNTEEYYNITSTTGASCNVTLLSMDSVRHQHVGVGVAPAASIYWCRDCRLLFVSNSCLCWPRPPRCTSSFIVVALLLATSVEPNPGLPYNSYLNLCLLNARSSVHKAAHIHDVIADDRNADIAVITEAWIPSDAPMQLNSTLHQRLTVSYMPSVVRRQNVAVVASQLYTARPSTRPVSTLGSTPNLRRCSSRLIHHHNLSQAVVVH